MEIELLLHFGLILLLIIFSGFFSGSETALFSLSLVQKESIKNKGHKKAGLIDKLLENPRRLIITILIGNDLVNITASVIAAYTFTSIYGEFGRWVAIAVMTPITLILAEIIPKTFCMVHNERLAPVVAGPLNRFAQFTSPLRWVFDKVADFLIRHSGALKNNKPDTVMEDDFLEMVDLSHQEGEIEVMEKELIHNVFEFSDTKVFQVMTPLNDFFSLSSETKKEDIINQILENGLSRIPVYEKTPQNITGILYAKDLLKIDLTLIKDTENLLHKVQREPYFIPETQKIDTLFHTLKQKRIHLAICLNEKGEVTGLVTMEDLLEELFGEIYDEYDREDK